MDRSLASVQTTPPAEHVWSATGLNGTITVQGEWVRIRKGLAPRSVGVRGERQVAIRDVTEVRVHPATAETNGYLELVLKDSDASMGGLLSASSGEHTVMFAEKSAAAFEQVRAQVQAVLDAGPPTRQTAA
ncbi:MAG TPA: DUF4429 domain-containing protein [Egibacteraceae bacterium]|nr:DUF4429 domain-containing protein [Egibacteraceae bacterium]